MKAYWTDKGCVSRWQLFLAYVFVAVAFAMSVSNLNEDNEALAAAITRECHQTNARNVATKKVLIARANMDIQKAKAHKHTPELFKKEIEGRRDVTLALIDALAPVQDCEALVAD